MRVDRAGTVQGLVAVAMDTTAVVVAGLAGSASLQQAPRQAMAAMGSNLPLLA
jgi:hypothetical protein